MKHFEYADEFGFECKEFSIDALRDKGAESNVSLLARLCFKNRIPPSVFWNEFIHDKKALVPSHFFNYEVAVQANSYSAKTIEFEKKFNKLVGGQRCQYHSYSFLSDILDSGGRGFIAPQKKWCPYCYRERLEESRANGEREVFDDLYWSVNHIRICMLHGAQLITKCYQCKSPQPHLSLQVEPGFCNYCNSFLGNGMASSVEEEELVRQQRLFHLFYISTYDEFRPNMQQLQTNLLALSGENVTGLSKHLGQIMGVAEDVVRKWIKGKRKPQLEYLFKLQEALGLSGIHQLFIKENDFLYKVSVQKTMNFNFNSRSKLKDYQKEADIREYLQKVVRGEELSQGRAKIAEKFDVTEGFLQHKFNSLCREVSLLLSNRLQEEKDKRDQNITILFDRALMMVVSRKRKWNLENVLKEIPDEKLKMIEEMSSQELTMLFLRAKDRRRTKQAYKITC